MPVKPYDMNTDQIIGNDRVRRNTSDTINQKVNQQIKENIRRYSNSDDQAITNRLAQLDREWDVERVLELNAATLALTGVTLAATHDKRWLILSGVVLSFFIQHALQGCVRRYPCCADLVCVHRKKLRLSGMG